MKAYLIFNPKLLCLSFVVMAVACGQSIKNIAAKNQAFNYTIVKDTSVTHGAVVSAHPLASEAGLLMLKKGGNAVDAAIATQFALAVVYPVAGNIGGGGFMVANLKKAGNVSLDYREKAPAAASRDMYLDAGGNPQMQLSQAGTLAAGVPGTVAGLVTAHQYGKLPWATLLAPAVELASNGFAITAAQAASLNGTQQEFQDYNTTQPVFVRSTAWKAGDTLVQKELAATLQRIQENGLAGFYGGETAGLLVTQMQASGGIITASDLANYKAVWRQPIVFKYKNYEVVTMPLPSSGGIILQQMLEMVDKRNLGAMGFQSAAAVNLMTEAERRAFADRAYFLGDPDFVKVPVAELVSPDYLSKRMADFVPGKAGSSVATKEGMVHESLETTHLSVIDDEGNTVSVTTTLNGAYGSKTVVAGAGFLLNNEMDDFSVKPGVPNMYGAVGNEKNAIAPNKRMLSSMTPTIMLKNGTPFMVVGSPGGTTIPTSVFQSVVNVVDFNMTAHDAVNKPKFHHQWLPDDIALENGFPVSVAAALQNMGYKTRPVSAIGRTEMILIKNGKITAVADHRGDDAVAGY